ncbi:MAG TPA: Fe-Mn family superoxide dismutase [Pyrinomonadaceae bacterium]|nr:Fe-Mn family superoxide dismutase [Pyrinomonadaceae bacterium]
MDEDKDNSTKITRREALAGALSAGAGILAVGHGADAQTSLAPAFSGKHQPKPLPFDAAKLNGISEKLIRSHHENNYTGAVKALNLVEQRLAALSTEKDLPPYIYGDLKRQELIRTGSVVLHELYFANLGGNGRADGKARKQIERSFGSFETWEAEFRRTGNSLSGGSGWTIFAYNLHTKEFHNYWSADHTSNAPFSVPLLVLDMYEHAYQIDYGAAAAKYVDAFMLNVNWEEVNRRIESLR